MCFCLAGFFSYFDHYLLNVLWFYFCQESQSQASPKHPPSSDATAFGSAENKPEGDTQAKSPSVESSGKNCHCLQLMLDRSTTLDIHEQIKRRVARTDI